MRQKRATATLIVQVHDLILWTRSHRNIYVILQYRIYCTMSIGVGPVLYRSNHQRCSIRKGVLRNFAKFTGKHLYQSLFFSKVAGHLWTTASHCNVISRIFSCECFCNYTNNLCDYTSTSEQLLLRI